MPAKQKVVWKNIFDWRIGMKFYLKGVPSSGQRDSLQELRPRANKDFGKHFFIEATS
jgi:hypothetical protein